MLGDDLYIGASRDGICAVYRRDDPRLVEPIVILSTRDREAARHLAMAMSRMAAEELPGESPRDRLAQED